MMLIIGMRYRDTDDPHHDGRHRQDTSLDDEIGFLLLFCLLLSINFSFIEPVCSYNADPGLSFVKHNFLSFRVIVAGRSEVPILFQETGTHFPPVKT